MQVFFKHSIATVANQFVVFALSVLATIFTARALGPEGKGQYTLAVLIPMLAVTFGRLGLGHAVNFLAPRTSSGRLISNTILLSTGLSLVMTAITLPSTILLKNLFFKDVGEDLILLGCLAITPYMLFNHTTGLLQSLYPISLRNRIVLVQAVANLGFLGFLVAVMELGVSGAIVSTMASFVLAVAFSCRWLFRKLLPGDLCPDTRLMRNLLHFGIKSHIGNILKDLSYRGDILILSCFLPASAVGLYAASVNIAEIVWKIPDAIGTVLLPKIAKMDPSAARNFTPIVSRSVLFAVSFICLGTLTANRQIILLLFGPDFLPSASTLTILLPGVLALAVWKILANDMVGQGHPAEYSLTTGLAVLVMIVLDLLLIPNFGIMGAAWASTASYLSATVSMLFLYTRITNTKVSALLVPTRSDFAACRNLLNFWMVKHTRKTNNS